MSKADIETYPFTMIQLRDFMELFAGRQTAYGQFTIFPGQQDGGKQSGRASTVNAPITQDLFVKHLMGRGTGIGIVPIKENGTCSFAVIDVDTYTPVIKKSILDALFTLNAPLCVFTSKSGGLHIYAFFETEIPAKDAIRVMQGFRDVLGLDKEIEIFPKQAKMEEGKIGNWINLPYYNIGPSCKRNLLSTEGVPIYDIDTALAHMNSMRQPLANFDQFFAQLPLQDAPPCLQRIYLSGVVQHRNDYLLSLAHYFKAKHGDSFDAHILEANQRLKNPLPIHEVMNTVIASSRKQDYKYACSKDPLKMFCNRKDCEKRAFGITSKDVSNLSFGEFRQIMTDPPYYEWVVDDIVLKLTNEDELINQTAFRKQCIRKLHLMPNRINEFAWSDIVNRALANVVIIPVDIEEDASPGAMLTKNIIEYLERRNTGTSREAVLRGQVYRDTATEIDGMLFTAKGLLDYLIDQKQMKPYMLTDLPDKLMSLGGRRMQVQIRSDIVKCWTLPTSLVDRRPTPSVAEKVDFLDSLGDDLKEL